MTDSISNKINAGKLEAFNEHLLMLMSVDLPLPEGIQRFARKMRDSNFKAALLRMSRSIEAGGALADAMAAESRHFPPIYTALVRIGEKSGDIIAALHTAIEQERFHWSFKKRLLNILAYPLLIFGIVCADFIFFMWYAFPVIADCYQATGYNLPRLIGFINAAYRLIIQSTPIIMVACIAMAVIIRQDRLSMFAHQQLLKIPLLGKILVEKFLTAFSTGMSTLLKAGVPVSEAFQLMVHITGNRSITAELEKASISAGEGAALPEILVKIGIFPAPYLTAVAIGLKSGCLPDSLAELADVYQTESEFHADAFLRIIDVALILLLGVFTGILLISMYEMYFDALNLFDNIIKW